PPTRFPYTTLFRSGRPDSPSMVGMLGPYTSASRIPTRAPLAAIANARLTEVVDLPTPPLPEPTAMMLRTLGRGLSSPWTARGWTGGLMIPPSPNVRVIPEKACWTLHLYLSRESPIVSYAGRPPTATAASGLCIVGELCYSPFPSAFRRSAYPAASRKVAIRLARGKNQIRATCHSREKRRMSVIRTAGPKRNRLAAALFTALLLPAGLSMAQQQDDSETPPDATTLDRVTVTGSLIPQTQIETFTPVTVISAEDIQARGYINLADVLQQSSF